MASGRRRLPSTTALQVLLAVAEGDRRALRESTSLSQSAVASNCCRSKS